MGVAVDEIQATKWFRRAAEAGHPAAMWHLAQRYRDGLGIEKDDAAAIQWSHWAAESGNADAMMEMARRHSRGMGIARSNRAAMQWQWKARSTQVTHWWRRISGKEWSWPGLPAPLPLPTAGSPGPDVVRT
jgi:TPR repeat protein